MGWLYYFTDRNLYTIRAVSLAEMRSIRRHTPAFGLQYIIIVLTSGIYLLNMLMILNCTFMRCGASS